MERIVDFINVNRDRYVDELKQYLAIPSISALPQHTADVRRCAEWTAAEMRRIGLQNVRLEETPGHPIVYGEWLGAEGAPTILFYGHYDVQPVDPVEPVDLAALRGDRSATARSTPAASADDKGQVFMHFKAVEAHMKQHGRLPVNMKFLHRGRGGSRQRQPRRLHQRHKDLLTPTSSSSATRRCSIAAFRRSATACAASPTSRSICAARSPICTRDRSAARSPIRRWCWRRCWRR